MPYWLLADLEARLSSQTVRQILDDDVNGSADTANITRLQLDSDSYVEGFLRGIYDIAAVRLAPPNEVKRLSLDVATAYAVDRWPDYVRVDGAALMDRARRDLMDLRLGKTRLDVVGTPEPAANQGGMVASGDPEEPDLVPHVFLNGLGDW